MAFAAAFFAFFAFAGAGAGGTAGVGGAGRLAVQHGQDVRARGVRGGWGRRTHRAFRGRGFLERCDVASVEERHQVAAVPGHGLAAALVERLLRRRHEGVDHQVTFASEGLGHRRRRRMSSPGFSRRARGVLFSREPFGLARPSTRLSARASLVRLVRRERYVSCARSTTRTQTSAVALDRPRLWLCRTRRKPGHGIHRENELTSRWIFTV